MWQWWPFHGHLSQRQEGLRCSGIPTGMMTNGMFPWARNTWWVSKAYTKRKKSWGLQEVFSLIKLATRSDRSIPGCIPSLGRLPRDVQGRKHCCTDILLEKGPAGAWSGSWEQCAECGVHTASLPLPGHAISLFFPVPCLQASCVVRIDPLGGIAPLQTINYTALKKCKVVKCIYLHSFAYASLGKFLPSHPCPGVSSWLAFSLVPNHIIAPPPASLPPHPELLSSSTLSFVAFI